MIPRIAVHTISPALERLFRPRTFRCCHELMVSEWWSLEKIQELQLAVLRTLVSRATPAWLLRALDKSKAAGVEAES